MPAALRRFVCERDGNQGTFVDAGGRRCTERRGLEFQHRIPYGLGGDRSPENVCLMCHETTPISRNWTMGVRRWTSTGGEIVSRSQHLPISPRQFPQLTVPLHPYRGDRVDGDGLSRGDEADADRDQNQDDEDSEKSERIVGLHLEKLPREESREGERRR